ILFTSFSGSLVSRISGAVQIIVTKNRFGSLGTVYQRFCNGHFVACDQDEARLICTASNAPAARGRRYAQGADV
ncbi:DnaB helicase C-terminal domain-containing protein, partial [Escherichia coli]|nr:DnaB helicase C-terminal domain-containing protein [Escherichia coli]